MTEHNDTARRTRRGNLQLACITVGIYAVLLGTLAVALAGCTRTRYVTRTETVEVRVPVPVAAPAPPPILRPELPIALVDSASTSGEIAQLFVATIVVLQGYAAELERLLDAYRPRSDTTSVSSQGDGAGERTPARRRPDAPALSEPSRPVRLWPGGKPYPTKRIDLIDP